MPRNVKIGSSKSTAKAPKETASQSTLQSQLDAAVKAIADLTAKLEARPTTTTRSGRQYEAAKTPVEVAKQLSADDIRDLHHLMVLRKPNTATTEKPYGEGVLERNKSGQDQYQMKAGLDRGVYIRLGKLARQMYGDPIQYRKPQPISDEQIDGILRPALDHLMENDLFSWDES